MVRSFVVSALTACRVARIGLFAGAAHVCESGGLCVITIAREPTFPGNFPGKKGLLGGGNDFQKNGWAPLEILVYASKRAAAISWKKGSAWLETISRKMGGHH